MSRDKESIIAAAGKLLKKVKKTAAPETEAEMTEIEMPDYEKIKAEVEAELPEEAEPDRNVLILEAEPLTPREQFETAVAEQDETGALRYGEEVLKTGADLMEVIPGFRQLAAAGYKRAGQRYITLTFGYVGAQRLRQQFGRARENIRELRAAISWAEQSGSAEWELFCAQMKCELACWYLLAPQKVSLSAAEAAEYRGALTRLREEILPYLSAPHLSETWCQKYREALQSILPAAEEPVRQTLKTCLRCGAPLTGGQCRQCGYQNRADIRLLCRVEPEKLTIAE